MGGTVSAADLITDLSRLEIRIEAHNDRLRYAPRSAVTLDLAERMKVHNRKLLAILHGEPDAPGIDLTDAAAVQQAPLDRMEVARDWRCLLCPPDTLDGCKLLTGSQLQVVIEDYRIV
jgi:hypothetical protein